MILLKSGEITVAILLNDSGPQMYCNQDCDWLCSRCKYGKIVLNTFKERYGMIPIFR